MRFIYILLFFLYPLLTFSTTVALNKMSDLSYDITNESTSQLNDTTKELKEVVKRANRIHKKENGYVVSPKGTGLENSNSTIEMLSMLPNLVSENGVLLLMGNAPIIYVDGIRITSQNEIEALQPQDIAKIEVEYQSVGEDLNDRRGVIRVTRSKRKEVGVSGYLSETLKEMPSYSHTRDNTSFGLDETTKHFTLNYWGTYNHQKLLEDADNSYNYKNGNVIESYQKERSWSNSFSNRLNLGSQLSKRSTLAISEYFSTDYIKNRRSGTSYKNEDPSIYSEFYRSPERNLTNQVVGKYNITTDSLCSKLDITADYIYQRHTMDQYQESNGVVSINDDSKEKTNLVRAKITWNKKYANGGNLKVGLNYQYIGNHAYSDNSIEYIGNVPSAFINYSGQYKRITYAAGITTQYNWVKVKDDGVSTIRDKFHVCPQVNFMWYLNQRRDMSLQIMYQQGIGTMPYSVISASHHYSTSSHYDTGNPNLQTPSDNQFSILFNLNRHFSFIFMGDYEKHPISYSHGIDADNPDVTWSMPDNGKYRLGTGFGAEYNGKPLSWWLMKVQAQGYQIKFSSDENYSKGSMCGKFWWNNLFNFTKSFGGSMIAYWETGSKFENYSWRPVGSVSIGLWKTMLSNKLRLSLTSMILGRQRKSEMREKDYISTYHNDTKITSFTFTLTWFFSKGKKQRPQIDATNIQNFEQIEEKKGG